MVEKSTSHEIHGTQLQRSRNENKEKTERNNLKTDFVSKTFGRKKNTKAHANTFTHFLLGLLFPSESNFFSFFILIGMDFNFRAQQIQFS